MGVCGGLGGGGVVKGLWGFLGVCEGFVGVSGFVGGFGWVGGPKGLFEVGMLQGGVRCQAPGFGRKVPMRGKAARTVLHVKALLPGWSVTLVLAHVAWL